MMAGSACAACESPKAGEAVAKGVPGLQGCNGRSRFAAASTFIFRSFTCWPVRYVTSMHVLVMKVRMTDNIITGARPIISSCLSQGT